MSIQKLPDDLINKIAAGEVIERPASIIKELVDNSIDAGATMIKIQIDNGGLSKIEVSDNGSGIGLSDLSLAFERHATSKIRTIGDLNNLISMGFRGEALSTIVSIAKVTATSKVEAADGNKIVFDNSLSGEISPAARDTGTTITVENVFANIPARQKFLKSSQTEFRKALEILYPYFLLHSHVHFILVRDGKEYLNLAAINGSTAEDRSLFVINRARAKQLLGDSFIENAIEVFYDGNGTQISGHVGHPSQHTSRAVDQYIFINGRPITDKGIYRAVHQGFARFIPFGEKIPFVISLKINPELVDVNVHPRKEEVRFVNPYRVFSAVEEAVKKALERETKAGLIDKIEPIQTTVSQQPISDNAYNRLRSESNGYRYSDTGGETLINDSFAGRDYNSTDRVTTKVASEPLYSDSLFDSSNRDYVPGNDAQTKSSPNMSPLIIQQIVNIFQMFNKYIVVEFPTHYWVIDQHAAAERINYERLMKIYGDENPDIQELLVANDIPFNQPELLYLEENAKFFEELGFKYSVDDKKISITAIPSEYMNSDVSTAFKAIFTELSSSDRDLASNSQKARQDIIATIACHTSIRSQQKLQTEEMRSLIEQLVHCDNPYSCPHGRPIVWKQELTQLDTNFERTY